MKCVILAGGLGTRLSEETDVRPKPMVQIGGFPIIWHIMKIYSHYGIRDFVICLGYRGYLIKEYFANYRLHNSNVTFDFQNHEVEYHGSQLDPWRITLVDTGDLTNTGGRLKRVQKYVGKETFMMTYGDGVGNVRLDQLLDHHRARGKLATVTATQVPGRFGALAMDQDATVTSFIEKPIGDGGWINGGFFVLEPKVFEYITDDTTIWEQDPLRTLAAHHQLTAFKHHGFWQPMDTLRDKKHLEQLWTEKNAPWKIWE